MSWHRDWDGYIHVRGHMLAYIKGWLFGIVDMGFAYKV